MEVLLGRCYSTMKGMRDQHATYASQEPGDLAMSDGWLLFTVMVLTVAIAWALTVASTRKEDR